MNSTKKAIALTVTAAMSLGLCAGVNAESSANITVTDNGSSLEDLSAQYSSAPPALAGAVLDVKRADIPAGDGKTEIPIENSSGMLGIDVQITKGGEYIDSVSVKNSNLVVKVRNPGTLAEEKEYAVEVTLYDMGTGKSSKFTVTGFIGASPSSSSSSPDSSGSYWPDASSKPEGGSSSSTSDKTDEIGLKKAVNGVVTANLYKYGGDDEAEFQITAPEDAGTIRLKEKDIIKGRDVIRKVSVSGKKLMVEAKFPYEMLDEPEDYEIQVTLEDSGSGNTAVCTVRGSVYWQDTDAPVSPGEYREKKYVVVDFDGNDGETINFKNGSIRTGDLKSGTANLDISYSGSSGADCDGLDLYCVNFPARPRLDRNVTVCLDADEGNCVYEVGSGGRLTKVKTVFNQSSGELRFETRRLGEYIVTEKALEDEDDRKSPSSSSSGSSKEDREKDDVPAAKEQEKDRDGSDEDVKTVPNTGRYTHVQPKR